MKSWTATNETPDEMKAIEKHFHVVLFLELYKVVLTFNSVDGYPPIE